eukprot:6482261-Amphidinium_carterae.1
MAALCNKASNRLLCQVVREYPITLMDVRDWVLNLLIKPAMNFASFSSIVLLGESGIGKTPLAHAIAMAFSAHYIEKEGLDMRPQFKTGTNLDLFRGDVGDTATPYVFDDGSLAAQIPGVMKAFLDVGGRPGRESFGESTIQRCWFPETPAP